MVFTIFTRARGLGVDDLDATDAFMRFLRAGPDDDDSGDGRNAGEGWGGRESAHNAFFKAAVHEGRDGPPIHP